MLLSPPLGRKSDRPQPPPNQPSTTTRFTNMIKVLGDFHSIFLKNIECRILLGVLVQIILFFNYGIGMSKENFCMKGQNEAPDNWSFLEAFQLSATLALSYSLLRDKEIIARNLELNQCLICRDNFYLLNFSTLYSV